MINTSSVVDGKSYRRFRNEWRVAYNSLVGMIRRAKLTRRCSAIDLGTAAAKVHTVSNRRPNSDKRLQRLERFTKDFAARRADWRDREAVCRTLRSEARYMMQLLEDVKARRPKKD